jgi:high affinity sulfate transporter 1
VLEGVLPIERKRVSADVVAGVTLAALAIPEVMGYTKIAETPVITGLYTILIPLAVYAILGSSRHLVVGADSATAAILAAGLAGMAKPYSEQWVALAGMLAIIAGGFLLLARLLRLGFLADFLSRTVLVGFLTGVGIQVAAGQVSGMLGVPGGTGGTLSKLWGTIEHIPDTSVTTLAVSLSVLAVIVGCKRFAPRIPGALIAVVGAIAVSWIWDLSAHGVAILGPVPSGLPSLRWPDVPWSDVPGLLGTAGSIFILILAQSAATSRAYAARYEERFDENVDLVGLAAANVAAGLSSTFVVNGSPTKTQMVDSAGGRSQVSQLATAVIVLIVLLFLTEPLQHMPDAVLASVVFLIGLELVDAKGMLDVQRKRVDEFVVAAITALVVVVVGVEQAIVLAIVLSLLDHIRRGYHPIDTIEVPIPGGRWRPVPIGERAEAEPGLIVYRFGASLYYANSARFSQEVLGLVKGDPTLEWFCLDASTIGDVDYSAGKVLQEVAGQLRESGVTFVLCHVDEHVREELDRYGVTEVIGAGRLFDGMGEMLDAYRAGRGAPGS